MNLVAYHSNLYFDAFKEHVKEIKAKGFDTVLFCISETDLLYNLKTFEEFRIYAESEGLVTWATFWGLWAGEAVNTIENKIEGLHNWVQQVQKISFRNIMIDEPKDVDIYELCYGLLPYLNINFHLCLTDDTFNKMSDCEISEMPVSSVGVSCYHLGHRDWHKVYTRTEAITKRLHSLRPLDNFIFIQAFDISEGMENIPIAVKEIAESNGIENFCVWSFRATCATSSKRPFNHKLVWGNINFSSKIKP